MRRIRDEAPYGSPESVWAYPRPPAAVSDDRLVEIHWGDVLVARTTDAVRVLETSHPPTWYLPPVDVRTDLLTERGGSSVCEWKGVAAYWDLELDGRRLARAAWSYASPNRRYRSLAGRFAFYPVDLVCTVDGVEVEAQAGGFYGGWITPDVEGPFKGGPGTFGW